MAQTPAKSVIVIGGGIVGLCIAVAAQASGHKVTLIARDRSEDTASGVAAGMIAPTLEARPTPYNDRAWQGMRNAQQAWIDLLDVWPPALQAMLKQQREEARSTYVWSGEIDEDDEIFFAIRHVDTQPADQEQLSRLGLRADLNGVKFAEDWLVDAAAVLHALGTHFEDGGGRRLNEEVYSVAVHKARLGDGSELQGDHLIVAAGADSKAFGGHVACLDLIQPIKGHLLDIKAEGQGGVVRPSTITWPAMVSRRSSAPPCRPARTT
ncbi:MAG: FAD-dependent oxidoreductase [Asticcacaulis sp.]